MVRAIDFYDRQPLEHPDRSYEWPIGAVRSRLGCLRAEGRRAKQGAAFQADLKRVAGDHNAPK
eukprot:2821287-Alexandrium_andersonii.AAC.1